MSEEAIADILAEMFDFSDKRIEEGRDHAMTSESVGLIVHQLAKRFEAAWKRESAGNAAAMREALVSIAKVPVPPIRIRVSSPGPGIIIHEPGPESEWLAMLRECVKLANAALSAPARNCDRFTSIEEARTAYCSECGRMISIWDGNESWLFEEWLFATAERKGEGDGR